MGESCALPSRFAPVSLVQMKSKHEHTMSALGTEEVMQLTRGHSAHEVLLGYKKYLLDILADPDGKAKSDYNLTVSAQQKDAIDIIKAMIDSFYSNFLNEYNSEVAIIQECNSQLLHCVTRRHDDSLIEKQGVLNASKDNHTDCRTELVTLNATYFDKCIGIYDLYRQTNDDALLPSCVAEGDLADAFIRTTDATQLATMEACLEEVHTWLDGLYPKYQNCKAARDAYFDKVPVCNAAQLKFESESCSFAGLHDLVCIDYLDCHNDEVSFCNELCSNMSSITEYRKADNKTGELVRCLLDVFVATNDKKKELMDACLSNQDLDQTQWDHECPAGFDTYPPALEPLKPYLPNCQNSTATEIEPFHHPCDQSWEDEWYPASEAWTGFLAPCTPCADHDEYQSTFAPTPAPTPVGVR